ncbi:hypothetical protein AAW31_11035 [Nitrosomonas communis]|uniref:Uncharacterized protein n=2 Tax=Nitrosomonas communis TaxID=44574 RepID=A0A0F7KCE3_9PROT|nr:hypothetical protein AAW31_11035 [Nitrosomonas communis]
MEKDADRFNRIIKQMEIIMSWQPINTAPKDRRILLAYVNPDPNELTEKTLVCIGRYFNNKFIYEGDRTAIRLWTASCDPVAWQELPKFKGVIDSLNKDANMES